MSDANPRSVVHALHRFGLHRDRLRAALAHATGLARADLDALEHLEADGPLTQRQLADRLLLTTSAVTLLVDRLERQGLLSRRPHPDDRRAVLLELRTESAEAVSPGPLAVYHRALARAASELKPSDRRALIEFLDRASADATTAVDALERSRDESPK